MVPSQFSRYRVLSRLGQGGMGEVFLAEDLSLNRKVALKFLLAHTGDLTADARLVREARAAAHLDHPFICKVYEVGEQDGRPFFAMEYVDGVTIKDRLAGGRIARKDTLRVLAEVADALQFAHARGIIHRDLKPANVMLGADGHVKVMDFGIAKRLQAAIPADALTAALSTATLPGEVTGTLAYMSPEQIRGEPVDQRSDVFAFGVLMHEMFTGTHPFLRSSPLETATAILNQPAPSVEAAIPDSPPMLTHIVARCLEKDRARRYQSLSDVRIELDALDAPATIARPARRSARWIASALLAAAATVGLLYSLWPLPFLAPEPVLAFRERDWVVIADFNNLTGDPVFDGSLRRALEVAIGQSQYVNVYPQDRVASTLRRMQRDPAGRLDKALAAEVALRDNIRGVLVCDIALLGDLYSITLEVLDPRNHESVLTDSATANSKSDVLGALDQLATRARTSLGESLATSSTQTRPLPSVTTSSLDALKLYAESMKLVESRQESASLQLLRQAVALDPQFALAHAALGRHYYLQSSSDTRQLGEKHYQTALNLTDRLTLRERLFVQASVEDSRGNRRQAADAFTAYLVQYPDDVSVRFRLAWTEMAGLQRFKEAVEGFKRVIALSPSEASAYVNLATAYTGLRDSDAAIASYQKAFDISPDLMLGVFVNHEYGFTLVRAGRPGDAAAVFDRMKKDAPPEHRARGFRSAALLEMYLGRYSTAVAELRQAIALNQTHQAALSEYRDRIILYLALEAAGRAREAAVEWAAVERLIRSQSLSPEWLWRPVKLVARRGRPGDAERLLGLMHKTASNTTAVSAANRNTERDRAFIDLAEGEVALARGRRDQAVDRLQRASLSFADVETLESMAVALVTAGRVAEAIARYEELLQKSPFGLEAQEVWFQSHLALGRLYEHEKRYDAAMKLYTSLAQRWKDGDADLPLLKAVRDRLAKLPQGSP
jgi:eukaryotic-like serine/threonine-protein kinase